MKLEKAFKTSSDTAVSLELNTEEGYNSIVGGIYERGLTSYDELLEDMINNLKDIIQNGLIDGYTLDSLENSSIKEVAKCTLDEDGCESVWGYEAVNDDDPDKIIYMESISLGQCDDDIDEVIAESDLLSDSQKQAWKTIKAWWKENQLKTPSIDESKVSEVVKAFNILSDRNTLSIDDLLDGMVND